MLPTFFSETPNHFPMIHIDAPYELFGEFLRSEHSVEAARQLFQTIDRVISGELSETRFLQDDAYLALKHNTATAKVWIDFLLKRTEESEMSIHLFRDIASAWLDYLEQR